MARLAAGLVDEHSSSAVKESHVAGLSAQPAAVGSWGIRKVTVRLLPFLGLLYLINYIDGVDVGLAALSMNADGGLRAAA